MKTMEKKRDIQLDMIRVIAMFFVIGVHCSRKPFSDNTLFQTGINNFLSSCNGMFFMLSGRFALSTKCNTKKDYANYYINKVCSVVFPMVFATAAIEIGRDIFRNGFSLNVLKYFKMLYEFIMNQNAQSHLWFMYPLIGMLLGAPFLAKMLDKMEDWELKLLFAIGIGWYTVSTYLTVDFNIGFSYSGWFLQEFVLYFFAGYFCKRIVNEANKKFWYVLGIAGFLITLFDTYIFPSCNHMEILTPAFLLFSIALYLLLQYECKIKSNVLEKIIGSIAKHSYAVYIVHLSMGLGTVRRIVKAENDGIYFLEHMVVGFAASLFFAMLMNYIVVFPVQRFVKKRISK